MQGNNISYLVQSNAPAGTNFNVTVNGVLNNPAQITTSSFEIYTYYDSGYDSSVDKVTNGLNITLTAKSITQATITPLSLTVNDVTEYQVNLTLNNQIPAGGYITIKFPPTVTPSTSTALTSASFNSSSCIVSYFATNTVTISNCANPIPSSPPISFTLSNILNPPS
jgi:hypothetical protein